MFPLIVISPDIQIPTYIAFLSLLYCFLAFVTVRRAEAFDYSTRDALDLGFAIMIGGFIGARLFHIFFENPSYYIYETQRVLFVWEGGFVFYGGVFGALCSALILIRVKQLPFGLWSDFYAPLFALGYGLGRLSCFFAGCCFGNFTDLPWAIEGRHPTQLYAVFWELGVFAILIVLQKKSLSFLKKPGQLFLLWVCLHSLGRLMMESFRADFRGMHILGLSISTFLSFCFLALALPLLITRARHVFDKS